MAKENQHEQYLFEQEQISKWPVSKGSSSELETGVYCCYVCSLWISGFRESFSRPSFKLQARNNPKESTVHFIHQIAVLLLRLQEKLHFPDIAVRTVHQHNGPSILDSVLVDCCHRKQNTCLKSTKHQDKTPHHPNS
jgi:hypothetical protein